MVATATDSSSQPRDVPGLTFVLVICVYLFVWLVSLALVFVFTKRESVALKKDIGALTQRLHFELDGPPASNHHQHPVNSQQPQPINHHQQQQQQQQQKAANRYSLSVSQTLSQSQQHQQRPAGATARPQPPKLATSQLALSAKDDDSSRYPLVVPSTPETKNLIMALAKGEDSALDLFNDAALPTPLFNDNSDELTSDSFPLNSTQKRSSVSNHSMQDSLKNYSTSPAVQVTDDARPNLLLRASAVPRIPNLWRRMFNISSAKFLAEDIDTAAKHEPHSPNRARFVEPLPPVTPLAARVHRLILAAIEADLKVLEARFKKDAVRYPPIILTFIGFELLAIFLFLFGSGLPSWPQGLPTLLLVVCSTLGLEILVSVLIRDLLTDLKAERAVLILSLKRVQSRAPYSLHFQATTFRSKMSASEYICIPFIAPFTLLFAPAAKKSYGATKGSKMHVRAPPKSLGGALGLDEVEADDGNAVIINGYVRPTVWTVTAELRVPKSSGHGGAVGSGLDGVEGQDLNVVVRERSGTHETFVNVGV